jgi:hypothetical protein
LLELRRLAREHDPTAEDFLREKQLQCAAGLSAPVLAALKGHLEMYRFVKAVALLDGLIGESETLEMNNDNAWY